MKKLLAMLMAVSMLLAMAGTTAGAEDVIEITYWHVQAGVNGQIVDQLAEEFNNTVGKELGIHVTSVYEGGSISQKLKSIILAEDVNSMPDIVLGQGLDTCYYRDLEQLVWAEDLIAADDSFSKDEVLPTSANSVTYDGRLMGMPFSNSAIMLYYNKDMFVEAGLDPEAPPQTIAEMAEYAGKLTKKDGDKYIQYGLAVTPDRWHVANWIGGQGEYSFVGNNESGRTGNMTEVVFGEEGTMAKFLTEYQKVVESGGLQPAADKPREEFIAGQYAMVIQSSSRINQFQEMSAGSFELGATALPKVDANDQGGVAVGGGALYILNRGDEAKINAAWEFVKNMCSAETQFKWHTSTGYIPTNAGTYDLPEMKAWLEENPMYNIPIDSLLASDPHVQEPMDPNPQELTTIYASVIAEFVQGKVTVEEAVGTMVQQCNDAMDLYYRANF